ncbi:MAG: hypothetical protein M1821_004124 [Bathelium mastoideum]|nr:MAG: hypothetical protein M1821_004124 [Bathelium mastoideum]
MELSGSSILNPAQSDSGITIRIDKIVLLEALDTHPIMLKYKSTLLRIAVILEDFQKAEETAADIWRQQLKFFRVYLDAKEGLALNDTYNISSQNLLDFLDLLEALKESGSVCYLFTILTNVELIAIAISDVKSSDLVKIIDYILGLRVKWFGKQQLDSLTSQMRLGVAYKEIKDYQLALDSFTRVRERGFRELGKLHPDTLYARHEVNMTRFMMLENGSMSLRKIEAELLEILDLRISVLGDSHPDTVNSLVDLARFYHHLGDCFAAHDKQEDAFTAVRLLHDAKAPKYRACYIFLKQLEAECAEKELQDARVVASKGAKYVATNHLARIYCELQDWKAAEQQFISARKLCPKEDSFRFANELDFSLLYFYKGELEHADKMQKTVIGDMERCSEPINDQVLVNARFDLSLTHKKMKREGYLEEMDEVVIFADQRLGVHDPISKEMLIIRQMWTRELTETQHH